MKKLLALLLLSGVLLCAVSCSSEAPQQTTGSTLDAEPSNDTLLYDEAFASINLEQYVTLPLLANLRLSEAELLENWETEAQNIREYFTTYQDAAEDHAAALGDKANIHYKGYAANAEDNISEDVLANMTNMAYDDEGNLEAGDDLVLGSNSFIGAYESEEHPEKNNPGFEEQLVGMKVGETRTITVTFPDTYYNSPALQGIVVKFDVTVNSIQIGEVPALSDSLISTATSNAYATVDDYKAYVLSYYKGIMAYDALVEAAVFNSLPTDLVDQEITRYIYDYIEYTYGDEDLTDEETQTIFNEQYEDARAEAEKSVQSKLILELLFQRYEISLTWAEYKTDRAALFQQDYYTLYYYYGITSEEAFEEYFGRDQLVRQCKYNVLLEKLAEQAVFE